ncbi:MAG: phenylalanine--tRNA ligase subunit beta, partial [Candidatus Hydrogenedentota bacterium]
MKLSWNWLNEYIDLRNYRPEEIANVLTMKSCEVEGVEEFLPHLDDILVAEVKSVKKHPNADKLVICEVFDGKETLQIVTGAPNVEDSKKYPLAKIGVTLPNGLTMKKAKLRGVESYGMLCSAEEIGLEDFILPESPEYGILPLPQELTVGTSLRTAWNLADVILDIDNKSITHRPDLWSHYGFARELSAILDLPLKNRPEEIQINCATFEPDKPIKVEMEKGSAIAYCNAQFRQVHIQPSSIFMQARLLACGMRPINNVVDASNYVMLAMGQPNHAFDLDKLTGPIQINFSKEGEILKTLDGQERKLPAGLVLIRDNSVPVALGGVMGGETTEVSEDTKELFFESACFYRKDIRKAVSQLGIRTEASARFEKGQTPVNAPIAIRMFANLLLKTCPSLEMSDIQEQYN